MKKLYGVSVHSLINFYDSLRPVCKKYKYKIKVLDKINYSTNIKQLKKELDCDVLLIPDYSTFCWASRVLDKLDCIVVIFDSPLYLNEINNLKFLDINGRSDLDYSFKLQSVDWEDFEKTLRKYRERSLKDKKINLAHQTNIISKMIDLEQETKFLGHYNNFMQHSTNHETATYVKQLILGYIFGDINRKDYDRCIGPYVPKRGRGKKYYENMIAFLDTEFGKSLTNALVEIKEYKEYQEYQKSRAIPYNKIAKKYNVDRYELKYLSKLYRSMNTTNRSGHKNRTIDDIAKGMKSKRSKLETA